MSISNTTVYLLLIFSLFIPSDSHNHHYQQLTDQSFISILISQNGLNFLKDLLVTKAISSLTPLQLPQIEKTLKIPLIGKVHIVLSNITIYRLDVPSSDIKPGDTGITIVGSGTTCNLSMHWHYSYSTWLVPVSISDSGSASVQVIMCEFCFEGNFSVCAIIQFIIPGEILQRLDFGLVYVETTVTVELDSCKYGIEFIILWIFYLVVNFYL